ncbi:hypothetical protein COOONC_12416 [Cooperia oncophora]
MFRWSLTAIRLAMSSYEQLLNVEATTRSRSVRFSKSNNFEVIEKIRAEVNTVTNGNRSVSLSDKEHTPYLNWAVLDPAGNRFCPVLAALTIFIREQDAKEDELLYDVFDLWIAGHETTALTLMWGFMHLMKNPDVRNFYEETD